MGLEPNALTTYATVKAELGLTDDTQQAFIERQINIASQRIENYCSRKFKKQTYTLENYEGTGGLYLLLTNFPVTEVTKIVIDDTEYDVSDFKIDYAKGIIYFEDVFSASGVCEGISNFSNKILLSIQVTYTAGYVLPNDAGTRNLPYDLDQCCVDEVVSKYEQKGTKKRTKSWSLGNASKSFDYDISVNGLLNSTINCLDSNYRRILS